MEKRSEDAKLCFGVDEERAMGPVAHHGVQPGGGTVGVHHGSGDISEFIQLEGRAR